jgi:hypothetical protein
MRPTILVLCIDPKNLLGSEKANACRAISADKVGSHEKKADPDGDTQMAFNSSGLLSNLGRKIDRRIRDIPIRRIPSMRHQERPVSIESDLHVVVYY